MTTTADGALQASGAGDLRSELVRGLIAAYDLAHGPAAGAVQQELARTLERVGVVPMTVQIGESLDIDRHSVAGTEPTTDPAWSRRVARTVRPGWCSGDRVLRPAEVLVWMP